MKCRYQAIFLYNTYLTTTSITKRKINNQIEIKAIFVLGTITVRHLQNLPPKYQRLGRKKVKVQPTYSRFSKDVANSKQRRIKSDSRNT